MNAQWLQLKLAIVFLTRLPLRIEQAVDDEMLNRATGYVPFVGALVAIVAGLVLWSSSLLLPIEVAVILSIVASILLTGAFHEDGLADTADGFGGGWTQAQKLNIMKDSRIGTYGATALLLTLLLKYELLVSIASISISIAVTALVFAHVMSRAFAVSLIASMAYVQLERESKTKPVAESLSSESIRTIVITLAIVALIAFSLLPVSLFSFAILFLVLAVVRVGFCSLVRAQIAGYTGDVLGAAQQVFELTTYVTLFALIGGMY